MNKNRKIKKDENDTPTKVIVLITSIIGLINAVITLIDKLV